MWPNRPGKGVSLVEGSRCICSLVCLARWLVSGGRHLRGRPRLPPGFQCAVTQSSTLQCSSIWQASQRWCFALHFPHATYPLEFFRKGVAHMGRRPAVTPDTAVHWFAQVACYQAAPHRQMCSPGASAPQVAADAAAPVCWPVQVGLASCADTLGSCTQLF